MVNRQSPKVIEILKDMKFYIACESNGTFPILPGINFATVSPKRDAGYEIHPDNLEYGRVHEFKYVVDEGFDFSILDRHTRDDDTEFPRLSLSPEFNRLEASVKEIIEYIKEHPEWRLSLQTHKWCKIP